VAYQQDLSTQLFGQLEKHTQHLKNSLPDHIDYLRDIHQRGILT
jgi:tryptophan halogenase